MWLSDYSIKKFSEIITGHTGITNSAEKTDVDELLAEIGFENLICKYDECFKSHDEVLNHVNLGDESFKLEHYVRILIQSLKNTRELKFFVENFIEIITTIYRDYSLKAGKDDKLEEIFNYLNEGFERDNYQIVKINEDDEFSLYSLDGSIISYECYFKENQTGQFALINQHYEKCIYKIKSKDYSGAITNSQSFLEQILVQIRNDINKSPKKGHNGDLSGLLETVLKLLNIKKGMREKALKAYDNLEEGFYKITNGIKFMRHSMSDAHNISHEPTQNDALLAVNTAKTLANFIVGHYFEKYLPNQKGNVA